MYIEKIFTAENDSKDQHQAVNTISINSPWELMLDSLKLFSDDFMNERNQLPIQHRNFFDA
jgi:hypothetical protein